MTEQHIVGVLNQVSAKYRDLAKLDILNALKSFKDLYPKVDSFTFADGINRPVCALSGTVPVLYRGNTYNIPVCLYLLDSHPYYAPICYVRPTPEMTVKPSQHVDTAGRIYLPYLSEWQHPKYDLLGLLQIMVMVFQDNCPVFARPSGQAAARPSPGGVGGTPYPMGQSSYMPMPQPGGVGGSPGRLPYPSSTPYSPVTSQNVATGNSPYSYSSAGYAPYTSSSSVQPTPSYPPPGGYHPQGSNTSTGSGSIQPEYLRASILSAVEDTIRKRLRDTLGTTHAELQSIRKTREDLDKGQAKLKQILASLQEQQAEMDSAVIAYQDKNEEIDKILASAPAEGELNVDDAIDTTAPLYRQLLRCFAEDNAIEDTIYYLGQALKRGQLDLETYLKHIRRLSRKQFVLRATMQKCREKAGLNY